MTEDERTGFEHMPTEELWEEMYDHMTNLVSGQLIASLAKRAQQ